MPIKGACLVAGIGVTTLAEWREKHPRLEDRMSEARELARQKALQAVKAAGEKDWRAHAEWLRLVFRDDYRSNANKVEVSATAQTSFVVLDEQLADIRSRLPAARKLVEAMELKSNVREDVHGEPATRLGVEANESLEDAVGAQKGIVAPTRDDSSLPLATPLNYAGQPMKPGEAYGGRS